MKYNNAFKEHINKMYSNGLFNKIINYSDYTLVCCRDLEKENDLLIRNTLMPLKCAAANQSGDISMYNLKNMILKGVHEEKNFLLGKSYVKPNTVNTAGVSIPCIFLLSYDYNADQSYNTHKYSCIDFTDIVSGFLFTETSAAAKNNKKAENLFMIAAAVFTFSNNISTGNKVFRGFKVKYECELAKQMKRTREDFYLKIAKLITKIDINIVSYLSKKTDAKKQMQKKYL